MRLHALDLKLLRDVVRLRGQAAAIALVLASGVAIFLTGFGMIRALEATQGDYYGRQNFAEVFAAARRAPRSVVEEIASIDGVLAVEGRASGWAVLDLPGREAGCPGRTHATRSR